MIWADLGRAVLLCSIPLAAMIGTLSFVQLWVVAFCTSTLSLFFTIASVADLPAIVDHDQLVEVNSAFVLSDSVLTLTGPSVAGGVVSLIGASKAILVDAISYVCSAIVLRGVALAEHMADRIGKMHDLWIDIRAGLHALVTTPLLWALTLSAMIGAIGFAMQSAVSLLVLTQSLGITPFWIGVLASVGGCGALVGALLAARVARVIGLGRTIVVGMPAGCLAV